MSKLAALLKTQGLVATRATPATLPLNSSNCSDCSSRSTEKLLAAFEARIRTMAARWGYSADELAEELSRCVANPAKCASWVERDERNFGDCVTPADFAAAYRRLRGTS
jgi:hypothetical protein